MLCGLMAGKGPRPLPRGWWSGRRRGLLARGRTDSLPGLLLPSGLFDGSFGEYSASHTVAGPRRFFTGLPGSPPSVMSGIWIHGWPSSGKMEDPVKALPLASALRRASFWTFDRPTNQCHGVGAPRFPLEEKRT
jgi:hypothetical protein